MKRQSFISKSGLITLWVLCLLYQPAKAQIQNPHTGIWEGTFMNDFKTALLLDLKDDGGYAGKILMYSGDNQIQNDEITRISIKNGKLDFYIADKETTFSGTFNEALTELSGKFVFPDNSVHLLVVRKVQKEDSAEKATTPALEKQLRKKIPVDELKSDLQHLIYKLREYHPRLYSYTSEDAFKEKVSQTFTSLDADMSLEEFYLEIAPLVASVKCSHTGIRMPVEYQSFISENGNFLPLDLFIQGKKAFSLSYHGPEEAGLVPGTEILSINQKPVSLIIEELLSMIPAEGNCQTSKYHEINRDFHTFFYLLDRSDSPVQFQLEAGPELSILKVSSFEIMDMEAYLTLLDTTFQALEKESIPNLVVDLRDNSGGHPIFAAQLLSYLTDQEFTYFQRNPDVADFEPLYNSMLPNKNHYDGNLYVLINGASLSTTGHLISLLKYHTHALFIGEEPGSSFLCNDFSTLLTLPNTGIEVSIPRTTFVTAVSGFDDKLPFLLDYKVDISVQDVLNNQDSYLLYMQVLLSENRL
jgi:C-terminal processing protease CtpA/Prc